MLSGCDEVVEHYDREVHSAHQAYRMPAVVRLLVAIRLHDQRVKFSRQNVLYRDGHTCQYCGETKPKPELTCDHVLPRAQGGNTSWENLVACCARCNSKKGGELLQDTNLKLLKKPAKPKNSMFLLEKENTPQIWLDYIQHFC